MTASGLVTLALSAEATTDERAQGACLKAEPALAGN